MKDGLPRIPSPMIPRPTRKPAMVDRNLAFFRSLEHARTLIGFTDTFDPDSPIPATDMSTAATNSFPLASTHQITLERLRPHTVEEVSDHIMISYDIVGGFSHNAIRIFWDTIDVSSDPSWIGLRTFTGLQLKYVTEGKRPPVVFALDDEDSYAYCDKDPCEACPFRCKSGFEAFVYLEEIGLTVLPIHQPASKRADGDQRG